jgi:hypothetical protein
MTRSWNGLSTTAGAPEFLNSKAGEILSKSPQYTLHSKFFFEHILHMRWGIDPMTDPPRPRGVRAAAAPPNALTASTFPIPVSEDMDPVAHWSSTRRSQLVAPLQVREPHEEEWLQPPYICQLPIGWRN